MKLLLRLYPRRWRARYGREFEALLNDSGMTPAQVLDVIGGALDARIPHGGMEMRRLLPWGVLAVCDVAIGWMNFHATDDVQAVAAALLLAGFGFGISRPGRAWLFAIALFLAVPLSGVYADTVSYHPGLARPHPIYESVIALIPAVVGAYAGAGVRWALRGTTGVRG